MMSYYHSRTCLVHLVSVMLRSLYATYTRVGVQSSGTKCDITDGRIFILSSKLVVTVCIHEVGLPYQEFAQLRGQYHEVTTLTTSYRPKCTRAGNGHKPTGQTSLRTEAPENSYTGQNPLRPTYSRTKAPPPGGQILNLV